MDSTSSGAAGADVGCVAPQPSAITVKANIIETSTRDISLFLIVNLHYTTTNQPQFSGI